MIRLDSKALRTTIPAEKHLKKIRKKRREIYFILDSVLDTYNVGGIFRLADALGVKKVYLCGQTETPPNARIKKASINTTEWVTWSYAPTAVEVLQELKIQDSKLKIIGVEQDKNSIPYTTIDYKIPVAFVVGNETTGISKAVLDECDFIAEIPMWGINKSLNVIVSLAIVSYKAANGF